MIVDGCGGEIIGGIADVTGVETAAGVSLNIASAAGIAYGIGVTAISAGNFYNDSGNMFASIERSEGTGKAVDDLPSGWTKTTNNGFTHVKDANGNIRVSIDPPDAKTPYPHKHLYDEAGNSLDINGNIVNPKSPDAHIPLK